MHQKLHHEEIVDLLLTRGGSVTVKDRFDMPGSIGVEGKQQKTSKNYTKHASYVADKALIENACINREALR